MTKALISLGQKELQSLVDEGNPVTLHCDFCRTDYTFEVEEVKELLKHA